MKNSKNIEPGVDFSEKIAKEIDKIEKRKFKVYFFVYDTKGVPNASLSYIYETALTLHNLGYKVRMMYSEEPDEGFVGVSEWLGDKYKVLKHVSVESRPQVSMSDFLFIPEIHPSVMYQTRSLPCKRVAIIQNYAHLMDMLQPGTDITSYGITDCITTSEAMRERIKEVFPKMRISLVKPLVDEIFCKPTEPKKMIVNVISKYKKDSNEIVKSFYLRYPQYKWVCFREVYGLSKEDFSELLKEGVITVWVDTDTSIGMSALEAMACGNIVIGKIPENIPDWMVDEKGIKMNFIGFNTNREAVTYIAAGIHNYINYVDLSYIEKSADETLSEFTREEFNKSVDEVYVSGYFNDRLTLLTRMMNEGTAANN